MTIACDIIKNQWGPLEDRFKKAAKAPLSMIRAGERLVNSMANIGSGALDDLLALFSFPDIPGTNSASALRSALHNLRNCAALAGNTSMVSAIDGAIDAIDQGEDIANLPSDFIDETKGSIAGAANSTLDDALDGNIFGKLDKLSSGYRDILKQTGLLGMLDMMDQIANCIDSVCQDAQTTQEYVDKINGHRDGLGIDIDGNADPGFATSEKIDPIKRQSIQDAKSAIDAARQAISDATAI